MKRLLIWKTSGEFSEKGFFCKMHFFTLYYSKKRKCYYLRTELKLFKSIPGDSSELKRLAELMLKKIIQQFVTPGNGDMLKPAITNEWKKCNE